MRRILFVCLGNLCRSPIAEAIATAKAGATALSGRLSLASSGTFPPWPGAPADPRAVAAGKRRGYDLSRHGARRVIPADLNTFDEIYAMDRQVLASLESLAPNASHASLRLFLDPLGDPKLREVPDPYYGNLEGFERVFDLCEAGVAAILGMDDGRG